MDGAIPEEERRAWLALHRTSGLGPRTLTILLNHFPSARAVLQAMPDELRAAGLSERQIASAAAPDWAGADLDLEWAAARPARVIVTYADDRYPALLREIADPPGVLFVQGDVDVLAAPQLAIVGSRNPTPSGRECARDFAHALAARGLTISSGLAVGVDGAAHRGALDASGLTLAVAGTGLDIVYPAAHRNLAAEIASSGALVSEFPVGTPVRAAHFPRRNRIISGLSLGVLVVEAALQSGSLITARCALDQGREVFAIPGSIHNPLARGCHALIREGAKLVESVDDVLAEIARVIPLPGPQVTAAPLRAPEAPEEEDPDYARLLECLDFSPATVDALVERTGLTPKAVSSMLLVLELRGDVLSQPGGRYVRSHPRR